MSMDINYELYKVFYYVGKSLSFSKASKELYISQSAVSQAVKVLEKKLKTTLFDRSTKRVRMTAEGELLYKHVETAVKLIQKGEKQILEKDKITDGQIRIAASDTLIKNYLMPIINAYHKEYPDIHIKLVTAQGKECSRLLEEKQVDMIISTTPCGSMSGYTTKDIKEFQDVFVANNKMYSMDEVIKLSELIEYPILMLDKDNNGSKYLHSIFLKHSLDLIPDMELDNTEVLLDLAKSGLGIAFVPEYCIPKDNDVLTVVNTFETIPKRKIVAAYDEDNSNLKEVKDFLNIIMLRRYSIVN